MGDALGFAVTSAVAWALFIVLRDMPHWQMRVLHVVLFGSWTYYCLACLTRQFQRFKGIIFQYALLTVIAALCELVQFWTPGHDPEWKGLGASLIGVVLGRETWRFVAKRSSVVSRED